MTIERSVFRVNLERRLQAVWYGGQPPALWMICLSLLYRVLLASKGWAYRIGLRRIQRFEVPIVVVGNITVGGVGKTPLVIALVDILRDAGYRPGVISRGYGSSAGAGPRPVTADSRPETVGDEPLLIHQRTDAPVMVGSNRVAAIRRLLADCSVDIIISDDGLQHQKMGRDLEIVVIDGDRRLGNGRLLPAGPLREPSARLRRVAFILVNGGDKSEMAMHLIGETLVNLQDGARCALDEFAGQSVHAIAAIGHPERFFCQLERAGIVIERHYHPDHHAFTQADLAPLHDKPIIMTEKDAIKCRLLLGINGWVLPVDAQLPASFTTQLLDNLQAHRL